MDVVRVDEVESHPTERALKMGAQGLRGTNNGLRRHMEFTSSFPHLTAQRLPHQLLRPTIAVSFRGIEMPKAAIPGVAEKSFCSRRIDRGPRAFVKKPRTKRRITHTEEFCPGRSRNDKN